MCTYVRSYPPPLTQGVTPSKMFGEIILELQCSPSLLSAQTFMKGDVKYNQGTYLHGK
jgi:hypothetical protein